MRHCNVLSSRSKYIYFSKIITLTNKPYQHTTLDEPNVVYLCNKRNEYRKVRNDEKTVVIKSIKINSNESPDFLSEFSYAHIWCSINGLGLSITITSKL